MNVHTVDELKTELQAQAADAPAADQIRRALGSHQAAAGRSGRSAQRSRVWQVLAVAAAVVAVAVAGTMIVNQQSSRQTGRDPISTGAPSGTSLTPEPGTATESRLRPIDLSFAAPVTVPTISGLQRTGWGYVDDRLWWFACDASGRRFAGFSIGTVREAPLVPHGSTPVIPTATPASTTGEYWLTAPLHSIDGWGFPAERRLSRQLPNGEWIQFFGSTEALMNQVADATVPGSTPMTPDVGIGLTIAGYTDVTVPPTTHTDDDWEDPSSKDPSFNKKAIYPDPSAMIGLCRPAKTPVETASSPVQDCIRIQVSKYATPPATTMPPSLSGGIRNLPGGLSIFLWADAPLRADEVSALLDSVTVAPGLADRLEVQPDVTSGATATGGAIMSGSVTVSGIAGIDPATPSTR